MTTQRPSILFIFTDQQSANLMSCTGTPWVHTPSLDGLAAEGVRFEHAICTNPICVPSRMGMATGMMPCHLGVDDNENGEKARIPESLVENSLGYLMKRAGYDTFYGGKVHMCAQLNPLRAGYDHYHADDRETLADACSRFVETRNGRPFFATASFINPHDICFAHNAKVKRDPRLDHVTALYRQACELPEELLPPLPSNFDIPEHEPAGLVMRHNTTAITPSGTMSETYSERDWRIYRWIYARLTEHVDRQIGRILNSLHRSGLERQTLVLFSSDHGNMHGNHHLSSKGVFYEESVRVPFIMKYPDGIQPGRVDDTTLVSTGLDILPTCCDYAGVPAPDGLLGVSQRRAAEGNKAAPGGHRWVVSENAHGRMLRTRKYKYTVYRGAGQREILTDLSADPGEMSNLAVDPSYDKTLCEYRSMLKEWFDRSGDADGRQDFVVEAGLGK